METISIDSSLVSAEWLNDHLNAKNLVILDASMVPVDHSKDKIGSIGIKGANYANPKTLFSDLTSPFPNTFPNKQQFEKTSSKLGIHNESVVVIYDQKGIYSSPRLWWLFKSYGHHQVAVLDGGFPEWKSKGFPTGALQTPNESQHDFRAHLNSNCIIDFDQISSLSQDRDVLIIDARSTGRFYGLEPEPREGLRGGHIPNSVNLPYTDLLESGKLKNPTELKSTFEKLDIENKSLVFTCGSGITACILALAADLIGIKKLAIYDGSWTEYGNLTE